MIKRLLTILTLTTLCALNLSAADALERGFTRPPDSARPWVYWFWLNGNINLPPFKHIGDIVAELEPKARAHAGISNTGEIYEDDKRLTLVRQEPNITLALGKRVNSVEAVNGVIRSLVAQDIRTARRMRVTARWFADCTGDGSVGALAGADFEATEKQHMGPSNLWNVKDAGAPEPFPRCLCEDTNVVTCCVEAFHSLITWLLLSAM